MSKASSARRWSVGVSSSTALRCGAVSRVTSETITGGATRSRAEPRTKLSSAVIRGMTWLRGETGGQQEFGDLLVHRVHEGFGERGGGEQGYRPGVGGEGRAVGAGPFLQGLLPGL